jgi:hypothetical protein
MPSAHIRVNSHLRPYKTSPSPAIRDTSAPAIQDISAPAIRDSSPAETCICNKTPRTPNSMTSCDLILFYIDDEDYLFRKTILFFLLAATVTSKYHPWPCARVRAGTSLYSVQLCKIAIFHLHMLLGSGSCICHNEQGY